MTVADQLISAAYRSIFGRDPDPEGFEIYRGFLGDDPHSRLQDMLDVLLASSEAWSKLVEPLTLIQVRGAMRTVGGKPVARVVSLGSRCNVAQHLQDFGLRDRSLPFDWIFSTPEVVVRCLEDDFDLFLQPEQYEQIPVFRRKERELNLCDHIAFRDDYGVDAMFNHRDPTRVDDYMYLQRCVQRFRAVQTSGNPTLYLVIADAHPSPEEAYVRLFYALEAACAGPVALLFVVVANAASEAPLPHVRSLRIDGGHELVQFHAVGRLGGTRFNRIADVLALEALLRRYQIAPSAVSGASEIIVGDQPARRGAGGRFEASV